MREADSAAGGKEDVKLGQRLHAGILNGELKRQAASWWLTRERAIHLPCRLMLLSDKDTQRTRYVGSNIPLLFGLFIFYYFGERFQPESQE